MAEGHHRYSETRATLGLSAFGVDLSFLTQSAQSLHHLLWKELEIFFFFFKTFPKIF